MGITIILPGGKSLESGVRTLLAEAGLSVVEKSGSTHAVRFPDYPDLDEGIFVKPSRIPTLVEVGRGDVGITGEDTVRENGADVEILTRLSFGRSTSGETRVVLFTHESDPINHLQDVPEGIHILSEYPNITRAFFEAREMKVVVVPSPGSCEAEVPDLFRLGVVLSETGSSLRENCLKPIEVLITSATVLVANKKSLADPAKRQAVETLQSILCGVLGARGKVLLSMNVPAHTLVQVTNILPAIGSPTIAPLACGGSSVSVVATKADLNRLIATLKRLGVSGIIATPLITMVP